MANYSLETKKCMQPGGCTWCEAWNGDEVKFGSHEVGTWGQCFLCVLLAQVGAYMRIWKWGFL